MNDYAAGRREALAEILGDERVPVGHRLDAACDLLEREVEAAFQRGTRVPARPRRVFTPRESRGGRSALQAGVLRRVAPEERA